jgi:hypothetical protein
LSLMDLNRLMKVHQKHPKPLTPMMCNHLWII